MKRYNDVIKSIIVTGATGFIGQHVIPYLLKNDYHVIAVSRSRKKAKQFEWFDSVEFYELDYHKSFLDLRHYNGVGLLHLAWDSLENINSTFHFEVVLPSNYNFIKDLVRKGVLNVLVTGTWMEYGVKNGELTVNTPTNPTTPYAFSKVSLKNQLDFLSEEYKFNIKWARLFSIYGEGQSQNTILSQLDSAISRGDKQFDMSSGEQIRDFLSIENVVEQLIQIYERPGSGCYNVCSENPISIRKLVEERVKFRKSNIVLNLGEYPINQPMAFWGKK